MIGLFLRHRWTSAERIIIDVRETDVLVVANSGWSSKTVRLSMRPSEMKNWVIQ